MISNKFTIKNTNFYLKIGDSGEFLASVAYRAVDGYILGAFYGHAGGGAYDGGGFEIDRDDWSIKILSYDDVEESGNTEIFNGLMTLCVTMTDNEDSSVPSKEGKALLKKGQDAEDGGRVVLLNDFDGDALSDVSEQWNISLRFYS